MNSDTVQEHAFKEPYPCGTDRDSEAATGPGQDPVRIWLESTKY